MASITIGVQSLLNTATYDSYTLSNASTVSTLKNFIASNASVSAAWYELYFNGQLLANANVLSSYGITANSQIRTANRIGDLPSREDRQRAKLDLATLDRTAAGNARNTYDISELPTQYSGNTIVDNANSGGLIVGRPWS